MLNRQTNDEDSRHQNEWPVNKCPNDGLFSFVHKLVLVCLLYAFVLLTLQANPNSHRRRYRTERMNIVIKYGTEMETFIQWASTETMTTPFL